ncbi:hypothetical protein D3C78_1639160 [compost metagenome]
MLEGWHPILSIAVGADVEAPRGMVVGDDQRSTHDMVVGLPGGLAEHECIAVFLDPRHVERLVPQIA